jgi:NAD(P)H dehydrogenase (quinone)
MKVFLLLAHPEQQSFNAALYQSARRTLEKAGHKVRSSDLYEMSFNPVSSRQNFLSLKDPDYFKPQVEELYASENNGFVPEIEGELQKLEWCDLMIWQFPLWWFSLPGILKGWVDRVFVMGRTYGNGRFYEEGVFKNKRALLSFTTGGPAEAYAKDGFNGDVNAIIRPVHRGILQFVGFSVLAPNIVHNPVKLEERERNVLLDQWAERLSYIEYEEPITIGGY